MRLDDFNVSSIKTAILAKNRSRTTTVIIRPNDKSTLDILTHNEKKGTKF